MVAAVVTALCILAQPGVLGPPPVRRGSWIALIPGEPGAVVLVRDRNAPLSIVVGQAEPANVKQAAAFLARDVERITGVRPRFVGSAPGKGTWISLRTEAKSREWESYDIRTRKDGIDIVGSNPRGAAFGAYELSERLGVDPLYLWTGYVPEKHLPLAVKRIEFHQGPPDVKYRGLFHDDEDVFPRPMIPLAGADRLVGPDPNGAVPFDDYKRYFETALRLKMNMVAPWVRTARYYAVQRLASDWGLYYTSHHYDTLLSDPYHFTRTQRQTPWNEAKPGLAELRGTEPEWDFVSNREGMIRFWKGGVDENRALDCIWPIGLRGTNDFSYRWPAGFSHDQILKAYEDAFRAQIGLVKEQVPASRERLFHFTMYTEMLPYYQTGKLHVPDEAIIVWPDNNDGTMRGLPDKSDPHKHGVYYHLAYLGGNTSKQTAQVVPLTRIETEFRKIFDANAREYVLVNVSDLREYVMGARFISDLCWNGRRAFARPGAADRFLEWWCREYFEGESYPFESSPVRFPKRSSPGYAWNPSLGSRPGSKKSREDGPILELPNASSADLVARAYRQYFASIPNTTDYGYGALKCLGAIPSLRLKFEGKPFAPAQPDTLPTLLARQKTLRALAKAIERARDSILGDLPRRFFSENLELAAAIDRLTTEAAVLLVTAMSEEPEEAFASCKEALKHLERLQNMLLRANRPPFYQWYGPSWTVQRNQHIVLPRTRLQVLLRDVPKSGS